MGKIVCYTAAGDGVVRALLLFCGLQAHHTAGVMRMYRRDAQRWQTPLGRWVSNVGVANIVDALRPFPELSVTRQAVYSWLAGFSPRHDRAEALVRLSGGRITLSTIRNHARVMKGLQTRGD